MSESRSDEPLISVVLPVYNEARVLEELAERTEAALVGAGCRWELLFINDGSTDGSAEVLDRLAGANPRVRVLHFSRNFGHQSAVLAGLEVAAGDAVCVMDTDLQDDPAALPLFLEQWRAGYDVVYAIRTHRKEGFLKRALFGGFYRVLGGIAEIDIPLDAGNFSLVDRRVARRLTGLLAADRYYPGVRGWVGFQQVGVVVERGARYDRQPRVSILGLWRLAKTAIFSFSTVPLTIFYLIAFGSMLVFLTLSAFTLYHRIFTGLAIAGWTSQIMTACFFGAINALGIGIIGEYVARIYAQVRRRPPYVIDRTVNLPADRASE